MTRLDIKSKADIRFFTYYLVNGTLDFDLLNNQLKTHHIEFLENNPRLFFESFCVFANHKQKSVEINKICRRVAEYICKSIEPENFQHFDNFENWEIEFNYKGNDFTNCLKDFAYKIAFNKLENIQSTENLFQCCITYGATFWETVFVIWANNLEFDNDRIINQDYAIERSTKWFIDKEKVEEWEIELEM